ncbi:MAG: DUF2752 domain-containing protein [Bergeyella zoohelcum]|nr:DUF2752 domain-containing protein [Bergeyella zoohelcum]
MNLEDYMLSCPNKKILGIECFGCGFQRAVLLLLEGKFAEAFYLFPAIYPLVLFIFFTLVNFIDKKRNYGKIMIFFAILSALLMIISYFYRHFFCK